MLGRGGWTPLALDPCLVLQEMTWEKQSSCPLYLFHPFFSVERHRLRKPPAGQGAGGRVQADHHSKGQPREHTQCQAGNYRHCWGLQRCRRQGRWEKGFLTWPKTGGVFTHSISNNCIVPQKHLGVTRRRL